MRIKRANDLGDDFFSYREPEDLSSVRRIIRDVRERGDPAVLEYTREFDGVEPAEIPVDKSRWKAAHDHLDPATIDAIRQAAGNIRKFSEAQARQFRDFELELLPGVTTGQRVVPVERVGVYVPGGRFPLLSTLLMGSIPARVAGVKEIAVCSPPTYRQSVHPGILAAADIAGVDHVYGIGGAQAIAALAFGTASVRRVDKIVGPGNKYVAQAKKEVFGIVGIDFMAGPTEVMIIADQRADPEVVAADLLAQAEHDVEAVPILVTPSRKLAHEVQQSVRRRLGTLSTKEVARAAIERNGVIVLVRDLDEAVGIANRKAPEHLELQVDDPSRLVSRLTHYGSLFVGEMAAEALGDYSSGINHTLPTNTAARYTGGLGVREFLKLQTSLSVTEEGLRVIGPLARTLAVAEGLHGHAESIEVRMKNRS